MTDTIVLTSQELLFRDLRTYVHHVALMCKKNKFSHCIYCSICLSAVVQGEGLWSTSWLLRGVPVCPPPGRHISAGRWLEDRERRRWRTGVCVGDQDGGEAVGDAQQVGFFLPPSPWEDKITLVEGNTERRSVSLTCFSARFWHPRL